MNWQDHWKVYREASRFCIERDGAGATFTWQHLSHDWGIGVLFRWLKPRLLPEDPDPLALLLHFFPEDQEAINKAALEYLDQQLSKAAGVPPHEEDIPW